MELAPCSWPIDLDDTVSRRALQDLPDDATRDYFVKVATTWLWNWTHRQFGVCTWVARPCLVTDPYPRWRSYAGRVNLPLTGGRAGPWPALLGGEWFNLSCGNCGPERCGCLGTKEVSLPGPVQAVTEVLIDGVALDPSAYRVDNFTRLVRTDGQSWPRRQDNAQPATEGGTWQVTYERGTPVPEGGQVAAAVLAREFALGFLGSDKCRLPQRVTSITRQGVSMALMDAGESWREGATGLFLVDTWVASVNEPQRQRGGAVFSPDLMPRRR